jgi:hypothetical protein
MTTLSGCVASRGCDVAGAEGLDIAVDPFGRVRARGVGAPQKSR